MKKILLLLFIFTVIPFSAVAEVQNIKISSSWTKNPIIVNSSELKIPFQEIAKIIKKCEDDNFDSKIWFLRSIELAPYSNSYAWQITWQRFETVEGMPQLRYMLIDMNGKEKPII
ncbi:MAG: hypothetical protein V1747_10940 [Candidatus Omnitrophota bacterium]